MSELWLLNNLSRCASVQPCGASAESNSLKQVVFLLTGAKRYQHEKLPLTCKRSHSPRGQTTDTDVIFSFFMAQMLQHMHRVADTIICVFC